MDERLHIVSAWFYCSHWQTLDRVGHIHKFPLASNPLGDVQGRLREGLDGRGHSRFEHQLQFYLYCTVTKQSANTVWKAVTIRGNTIVVHVLLVLFSAGFEGKAFPCFVRCSMLWYLIALSNKITVLYVGSAEAIRYWSGKVIDYSLAHPLTLWVP